MKHPSLRHVAGMVPGAPPSTTPPLEVRAPFDGALLATVETADAATVDHALATAHALFRNRDGWLPPAQRIDILRKAAALLEARASTRPRRAVWRLPRLSRSASWWRSAPSTIRST